MLIGIRSIYKGVFDFMRNFLIKSCGVLSKYSFSLISVVAFIYVCFFNSSTEYIGTLLVISGFLFALSIVASFFVFRGESEYLNTSFPDWYLKIINLCVFVCAVKITTIGELLIGSALIFTNIVAYIIIEMSKDE